MKRLAHDGSQLAAAIREYGAEHADLEALMRLEERLAAAFVAPGAAAASEPLAPAWLLSLSTAAFALAVGLFLQRVSPVEQPCAQDLALRSFSATEIAGRMGVSPRELASEAAMEPFTRRVH